MTFAPVQVSRGRKFRGFAYFLCESERPIAYGVEYYCATLWDPAAKKLVYANTDFCDGVNVEQEKLDADKAAYIDSTIQSTIAWCKEKFKDKSVLEQMRIARNILRKHHPEMLEAINKALPDSRDVVDEVEKTLRWAASLRTRQMYMYGKLCPGGKPYSPERTVSTAYKALVKRGVTKLDGFTEAWEMQLTLMALPKPDLEKLSQEYQTRKESLDNDNC